MKKYYIYYKTITTTGNYVYTSSVVEIKKLDEETIRSLISEVTEEVREKYLHLKNEKLFTAIISLIKLEN